MGDVNHAKEMINEYSKVILKYPDFQFGFKLQFRNLKKFIHKSKQNREDLHYIKRFNETKLSNKKFKIITDYIKKKKFISIATPFDEDSVDLTSKLNIEIIKVASCSFNDWNLLEKIAETKKPVIASTAGATEDEIDNVIAFFKNRKKEFGIMHCVAEYPTPNKKLNLNRLKFLKEKYPEVKIGYSTHENPKETNIISSAIAIGATIFEKHVGLEKKEYKLNKYSAGPKIIDLWLKQAKKTYEILGQSKNIFKKNYNEINSLNSLKRGVFARKNLKVNSKLTSNDFYLAFPPDDDQLLANDVSKYNKILITKNVKKDYPINNKNAKIYNHKKKILSIINKTNLLLKKSNHIFSGPIDYEISHHYGLEKFEKFGLVMLNIINGEYCKKILVLFKNQKHPEQYHNKKKETFHILSGSITLRLNGIAFTKSKGDIITIDPKVRHEFSTKTGAVIEEISTTHNKNDSFYVDKNIHKNFSRKTNIKFVWE